MGRPVKGFIEVIATGKRVRRPPSYGTRRNIHRHTDIARHQHIRIPARTKDVILHEGEVWGCWD